MRAGFAERDITPERGMERPGSLGKRYHEGPVHDPCKVRAAVFDDGPGCVALVGVDTVVVPERLVRDVRTEIAERSGLRPDSILIAATHSHSGGPLGLVQPGECDDSPEWVRRLAYDRTSCADPRYLELVHHRIVDAVIDAYEGRADARCGVGSGHEAEAAFNRRFRMKNGLTFTYPGHGNPESVEPAGPIDPEVGVVGAWSTEGSLLGCVVNYACHGTTDPGGTSADWIYYMEETIRGGMGGKPIVVFLQGACGDISHVDQRGSYARQTGERWARYVGGRVGAEALKALVGMIPGDLSPVAASSEVLRIQRRRPDPQRLTQASPVARREPPEGDLADWIFAKETVLVDALVSKEPEASVEAQAIQIGPAVFLASPGELFCELGLELKAAGRFPFTFAVSLANGRAGYLPTPEAFGEGGGGYETRLSFYSNLHPDAGPRLVAALTELAAGLTPGPCPAPPSPPPFEGPWPFGNVPPDLGT